ncbi:restriction endonuclease subunit S [Segatella copri]|uniref:restriction endonuclease subunit S n=1 Tax=Segatella copri TaxID=165179 RepID=UPI001C460F8D|nr:restriction endonuclease subunit S [Segatella copri]MBW0028588.1 restriction endonuclease subunit S [Segatella copri]
MDTKALRQKILDLAIHGKLVPQDPNDEPASVLLERIRAEKERLIKEGKIKKGNKSAKTSDKPHYPYELPKGWVWTTVEDVCSKIGSGSTPKGSNYSKEGIPFFRSQNVYNSGIVMSDIKYISDEIHQMMIGTEVVANDLLLNITGGSLGRCAVIPSNFEKGNVSQHVCILRPIVIKPEFLHCFILSSFFAKSMKITGSGREGLPKYNLEKMLLPLPPEQEQERIVAETKRLQSFVDELETSCENMTKLVAQVKSKVLDLAIHGKLVPQDSNDEPACELLKRINPKAEIITDNGHYQKLPVGWTICRLKDISKIVTGSTPSKSNCGYYGGIFPFFKPADLDAGRHVYKAAEYLSEDGKRASRVVPKGTTAICCIGTIGKVGYLMYEGATNQQINCAIPSKVVDSVFLFYLCASPLFNDKLNSESSAVTISIVNKSKIEAISVPLPPLAEQKRIVSKIEDIFAQLEAIETAL